ncbi:UNVERIFIED_CONTAM: hypothetical protein RMT77_007970 [Armadillidium vulgare]
MTSFLQICLLLLSISFLHIGRAQNPPRPTTSQRPLRCPKNWVQKNNFGSGTRNDFTCYKFVRSPKKTFEEAKALCGTYQAELTTINTNDEHGFITRYLHEHDPLYRIWYVGIVQKSLGYWENEDGTPLLDVIQQQLIPDQVLTLAKKYMGYTYSYKNKEWGLLMVDGTIPQEFICEVRSNRLSSLLLDSEEDRDYEYGTWVQDPKYLPRGPKIIHQPESAMFDLLKRDVINHVSITCLADGYPAPTYEWFKEEYVANKLESKRIDPLQDTRFTVSGGSLIINRPKEIEDRGNYFCLAKNKYGAVVSGSVPLSFAYMAEFNLKRSDESGNQNWGKAIFCDPPRYFPDARFYWSRDFFPNFVDEDKRTFVSFDGNLYFSYLDNIDEGLYSCTVQSTVSDIGRHGPFFRLNVFPHPNFQQLKFANNFPKAFPDSPVRGDEVRLECIAFGYPVPSYNWTRRNGNLPRGSRFQNYNRVLILPQVEPADIGDYVCRAENSRMAIDGIVSLSIQATPKFTIPLTDNFVADGENLMMECEAFAIPDVTYSWYKDAKPLVVENLTATVKERYTITDNVFQIEKVTMKDEGVYQCKATNQLSSSYSSSELRVLKLAPTFKKRPLEPEIYAAVRTNISISCQPEAAPTPEYEWWKDGLKLGRGGHIDIQPSGELSITMVTRDDRGTYNCSATNKYGSDYSVGRLIVLDEPYWIFQLPEEINVSVGEDLHLRCEAVMDEILDLTYVWTHNELRIQVDQYVDPYLTLNDQNYFTDFYARRYQETSVSLENEKRIQTSLGFVATREPPYQMGYHPGHLFIRNLTLEDAGYYMCDAKSPIANISQVTKVVVSGPPGPPGGITALSMTSTSGIIRWTNGATNGREIIAYTIQAKTLYTDDWKTVVENITAQVIDERRSRMEYQLPQGSLTPWASYKFRVQAVNYLGTGIFSEFSPTANTHEDVPFKAPSNVGGGGGKTGDLTITWDPLSEEDQNAPGVYYRVFWRRKLEEGSNQNPEPFKQEILRDRNNKGMFVATVEDQFFYTLYEVKVQSANRVGWGPQSEIVTIYSAEGMPQVQPTEVKAWAFNSTSMNITWRPIEPTRENIRGELIGYRLKYWPESHAEIDAQIRLKLGTEPQGLIVGLKSNTYYWVRVMAYNSAGSGPESEKFRERTWRDPPSTPPNAVEVQAIDPETIYVKWRGITPESNEESLQGYKVRVWESDQDMTTANDTLIPLGQTLEAYISGLQLGKTYYLRVLAYSKGGDGKMSSPPWFFSLGDPNILRAEADGVAVAFYLIYLLPLILFFKR